MQLSKKAIFVVIGLASLALVGLSVLQIQNLRSSIKTNKQIFLQKVDLAASKITKEFLTNDHYSEQLRKAEHRMRRSNELNDPIMHQHMKNILEPIFKEHGIDLSYEYAVYMHKEDTDGFNFVMGDDGAGMEF